MDILVDPYESFAPDLDAWSAGLIPTPWLERYVEPIVVLAGVHSTGFVRKELDRSLLTLHDEIRHEIEEQFGIDRPWLPEIRLEIVRGGLEDWRSGAGQLHFLAARCNGCSEVFPTYWTETWEDRYLALEIERVHPVIPFLRRQVSVFQGLDFAGCFCGWCDGRSFHEEGRDADVPFLHVEVNPNARTNRKIA